MAFVVVFLELGRRHVCINLCRAERLVSEQLLDASQIGSVVEHVGREGVSECMRADRRIEAGRSQILVKLAPNASSAEPLTVFVDEHGVLVGGAVARIALSHFEVPRDRGNGRGADGRNTFLASLASNSKLSCFTVDVVDVQSHQFADADAGRIKCFEHGPVARAEERRLVRRAKQLLNLFEIEEFRQPLFLFRRANGRDRIGLNVTPSQAEFVETSQGGELSGGGCLGVLPLVKKREEGSNLIGIRREQLLAERIGLGSGLGGDGHGRSARSAGGLLSGCLAGSRSWGGGCCIHRSFGSANKELTELVQVRRVTLACMRREVPLIAEIVQEFCNKWMFLTHDRDTLLGEFFPLSAT